MDQVHVIRHAVLKQGRSRRSVALELGVSRNTVRKYLEESEPRFSAPVGRRQPVLERVKARLDELLAEWSARTTAKQRITGSRLHGQLRMEGFDVGITLVRQDFRAWRRQRQETVVPLVHRPGDSAQVDFFEVTVEGNGERRKALMFAMRLMYSGRDDVWLYERCDLLANHGAAVAFHRRVVGGEQGGAVPNDGQLLRAGERLTSQPLGGSAGPERAATATVCEPTFVGGTNGGRRQAAAWAVGGGLMSPEFWAIIGVGVGVMGVGAGVLASHLSLHRDITTIYRELANLRERMAKLEGAVEGFMRGQIPRDAA